MKAGDTMNEMYTGRRERDRSARRPRREPEALQETRAVRLGKLFLKQTAAAIVCAAVVWGMHSAQAPRLNRGAEALGRALKHESDLSGLQKAGQDFSGWFRAKFAPEDQKPQEDPADTAPDQTEPPAQTAPPDPASAPDNGGEVTEH